jgi:peptidoglycan/xylan/chitin deacetylase (PgdA/CDA1 family)
MYHALEDPRHPVAGAPRGELVYVLPGEIFRAQMRLLADSGTDVILPEEDTSRDPRTPSPNGAPRVVLTFDDGHASNHSIALPALLEHGFRGIFFITTDWTGAGNYMSAGMIRELAASGMIVGSHGRSHRFLTDLNDGELIGELAGSKRALEEITGTVVDSISAPGGRIDGRVAEAARAAGYRWIFDSVPALNASLVPGRPAHRFAVMRSAGGSWFERVVSGNPPRSAAIRFRLFEVARKLLGNRLYASLRETLLGGGRPSRRGR